MSPETLAKVPLFQHVSPHRLTLMLAQARVEQYKKGALLFRQGDRAESVWIVLEGWVHLMRSPHPADGSHAVVLFTITPDEALCGISAIDSGTYNLSAVAGTTCRLVRIPGAMFRDVLMHEAEFAYHTIRLCARRMQQMAEQYGAMAEPVSKRIIRAMLRLRQQFGTTLPVTHRELAQMSWTTTESAIRLVRTLKQRGYVAGTRGRLTLAKPKALAQLLGGVNGHQGISRATSSL